MHTLPSVSQVVQVEIAMNNVVQLPRYPKGAEAARISQWLRNVLASQSPKLTAERWGKRAGVSPTTITKFLNHSYPVPKQTTIAALAKAAGLPPPVLHVSEVAGFVDVPLILPQLWKLQGEVGAKMAAVEFTQVPARLGHCSAVRIETETATLSGVLPGDVVIFDPKRKPAAGELVVVAMNDGRAGVYMFEAPYLLPRTATMEPPLPAAGAHIMGVAMQVQRDLPLRG
jgi:hypothetical protein